MDSTPKKSATGLIVLIILSSLFLLLFVLPNCLGVPSEEEIIEQFQPGIEGFEQMGWDAGAEAMADMAQSAIDNGTTGLIISLVIFILGALSIVLMALRYKQGFMMYVVYTIVQLGSMFWAGFNVIAGMSFAFFFLFAALFVWLYSRQRDLLTKSLG